MIFFLSIALGPLLLIGLTQFISSVEKKAEAREVFVHGKENSSEIANFFARQDVMIKEPKPDFRALIKDGKHDPVLVIPRVFEEKFNTGTAEVELVFDDTRQDAGNASIGVLRRLMRGFNAEVATQRLILRGVSPQLTRNIERLSQFLALVGLISLLVAGVGVGHNSGEVGARGGIQFAW